MPLLVVKSSLNGNGAQTLRSKGEPPIVPPREEASRHMHMRVGSAILLVQDTGGTACTGRAAANDDQGWLKLLKITDVHWCVLGERGGE